MSRVGSYLCASLAIGLIGSAQLVYAGEVRHLRPSSKWVLNYADESCRLARTFGQGDSEVTLVFDQFLPGEIFKVTVAGKVFRTNSMVLPARASIRFGSNEQPQRVTGLSGMLGSLPAVFSPTSLSVARLTSDEIAAYEKEVAAGKRAPWSTVAPEREKAATWVELKNFWSSDFVLETGPLSRPMESLRECAWDTVKRWGLDVDQLKGISRGLVPKTNPTTWIGPKDYPKKSLRAGEQAVITFRLLVDETGKPTDCLVQRSTRSKDVDEQVCRIFMNRAAFVPALDRNGKPVRSYFGQTIAFRIAD